MYKVLIDGNATKVVIPENLEVIQSREGGQQYFRTELSEHFVLLGQDALYVIAQPFEHLFTFELLKDSASIAKGTFMRTSCKIDEPNRRVEVTVKVDDGYNRILDNIDTEVDLFKLDVPTTSVLVKSRPVIQIYVKGSTKLNCYLDKTSWQQDVSSEMDDTILRVNYGFSKVQDITEIYVRGANQAVSQIYAGNTTLGSVYGDYTLSKDGNFKITIRQINVSDNLITQRDRIVIINTQTNQIIYVANKDYALAGAINLKDFARDIELVPYLPATNSPQYNSTDKVTMSLYTYNVYARLIAAVKFIGGSTGMAVNPNDMLEQNLNYRYVFGYRSATVYHSMETSTVVTKYGMNTLGSYYYPPNIPNATMLPLSSVDWHKGSLWFSPNLNDMEFEAAGRHSFKVGGVYRVKDILNSWLKYFKSTVTYGGSDFLDNIANTIGLQGKELIYIPKSNILHGEGAVTAKKVLFKLSDFFNSLEVTSKLFWHVEGGKLYIEHLDYYTRGGSYTQSKVLGFDLTALTTCGKPLPISKANTGYEYEAVSLPTKIQFNWMDEVSPVFEGSDINIISKYSVLNTTDTKTATSVSTDIDYLVSTPSTVNPEGFAMVLTSTENVYTGSNGNGYIDDLTGSNVLDAAWARSKMLICRDSVYFIRDNFGRLTDSVKVHAFDVNNVYLTRIYPYQGKIITPKKAEYIVVSWKVATSNVEPTFSVLMLGGVTSSDLATSIDTISYINETYRLQNGNLSWPVLQGKYYRYGSPAKSLTINSLAAQAITVEKHKKNSVEFTAGSIIIDPKKLIKTSVGLGEINKISVNLRSQVVKADLQYSDD